VKESPRDARDSRRYDSEVVPPLDIPLLGWELREFGDTSVAAETDEWSRALAAIPRSCTATSFAVGRCRGSDPRHCIVRVATDCGQSSGTLFDIKHWDMRRPSELFVYN
jgi:hypothetical protein